MPRRRRCCPNKVYPRVGRETTISTLAGEDLLCSPQLQISIKLCFSLPSCSLCCIFQDSCCFFSIFVWLCSLFLKKKKKKRNATNLQSKSQGGARVLFFLSEAFRPDKPSVSVNGVVGVVCSPASFQTRFFPLKLQKLAAGWLTQQKCYSCWFHKPAFFVRRTQTLPATLLSTIKLAIICSFVWSPSFLYDTWVSLTSCLWRFC